MGQTIYKYITENIKSNSNKTGIIFNDKKFTYHEINDEIIKLINYLKLIDVKEDDTSIIITNNSPFSLFLFIALTEIGVKVVPVNPNYAKEDINYIIQYSGCKYIFHHYMYSNKFNRNDKIKYFVFNDLKWEGNISTINYQNNYQNIDTNKTAAILFSSGTTSENIMGTISSHNRFIEASEVNIQMFNWLSREKNVFTVLGFLLSPLSFGAYIIPALRLGHTFVINSLEVSVDDLFKIININKINSIAVRPSFLKLMLDYSDNNYLNLIDLKECFLTGEYLERNLLERAMQKLNCNFYNFYGSTETFAISYTSNEDELNLRFETVGKLCPKVELKIIDNYGRILQKNQVGEICVKSPFVMQGYLNLPEKTNEVLDKDGFIHTGDAGMITNNNYLKVLGRKKNLVIKNKNYYFIEQIEEILNSCSLIEESALGIINKQNDSELFCFIKTKNDEINKKVILNYFKENLINDMIPDHLVFCNTGIRIPKTPNKKINREKLKEFFLDLKEDVIIPVKNYLE